MQVKILQSIASATFSYRKGEFIKCNAEVESLAKNWAKSGICEIIDEPEPEPELSGVDPVTNEFKLVKRATKK